jgi:hypothetical protein
MWSLTETVSIGDCRTVALLESQEQVYGEVVRYFRNLMTSEVRQLNDWGEWTAELGEGSFFVRSGDVYELRVAQLGYIYNGMSSMSIIKAAQYIPPKEDNWVAFIEQIAR